jgi:hypothetical protein
MSKIQGLNRKKINTDTKLEIPYEVMKRIKIGIITNKPIT